MIFQNLLPGNFSFVLNRFIHSQKKYNCVRTPQQHRPSKCVEGMVRGIARERAFHPSTVSLLSRWLPPR
ncbi:hypothetical protein ACHAXH_005438 [Discostella pseudostelligera]